MKKRGEGMRENEVKRRGDLQGLLGGPGDDVLEVSEGVRATCTCIQQKLNEYYVIISLIIIIINYSNYCHIYVHVYRIHY